jgi:hypothetical protein
MIEALGDFRESFQVFYDSEDEETGQLSVSSIE